MKLAGDFNVQLRLGVGRCLAERLHFPDSLAAQGIYFYVTVLTKEIEAEPPGVFFRGGGTNYP